MPIRFWDNCKKSLNLLYLTSLKNLMMSFIFVGKYLLQYWQLSSFSVLPRLNDITIEVPKLKNEQVKIEKNVSFVIVVPSRMFEFNFGIIKSEKSVSVLCWFSTTMVSAKRNNYIITKKNAISLYLWYWVLIMSKLVLRSVEYNFTMMRNIYLNSISS